jgi:hypothetical protein
MTETAEVLLHAGLGASSNRVTSLITHRSTSIKGKKVKISLLQAMEAHRVTRG